MAQHTAPPESIVDVLSSYHRAVTGELDALTAEVRRDAGADVAPTVERLVTQIVGVLVAEEQYLLPQLRETLTGGDAAADAQFARHREIEHELHRLEDLDLTPELLVPILAELDANWARLTGYLDVEVFPVLRRQLSVERLAELGDDALGAMQNAPTRPRELAPKSPTLSKIFGVAEGFVDRARDAWSHRGRGADDVTDPEHDAP